MLIFALAGPAAGQDGGDAAPLSAIDWLSQSVALPAEPPAPAKPDEPPVSGDATAPQITVTPLDIASPDGIGLLPPEVTGLPHSLWSASDVATLADLIRAQRPESLPAVQDLLVSLMLAAADPPIGSSPAGDLLLARVDKLLDMGALQPAQALLEAADQASPALYRRWFDVSLLTGTESRACGALRSQPALAPTYPARIFCLARNGDWPGAALTLNTARALGDITDEEDELLSRFLDPALGEDAAPLAPPSRPSPLVFMMREAIGEGLPTAGLPLAFAHADLRPTAAWRYELTASERLVRYGAISDNELLAAYTRRTPAASGGVWDRAAAVQDFEAALASGDTEAVASALPEAWAAFVTIRAEPSFARLFGEALAEHELSGEAAALALEIQLLSPLYEAAAASDGTPPLLAAVARGDMGDLDRPAGARQSAVFDAFSGAELPAELQEALDAGKLGETILRSIALFGEGLQADPALVRDALAVLRAVGLEDTARRAALQYLILERET